jgi:hypothetical protein
MKILHLLLIIRKVLILIELTFIAEWRPLSSWMDPFATRARELRWMSIQSKLAMM